MLAGCTPAAFASRKEVPPSDCSTPVGTGLKRVRTPRAVLDIEPPTARKRQRGRQANEPAETPTPVAPPVLFADADDSRRGIILNVEVHRAVATGTGMTVVELGCEAVVLDVIKQLRQDKQVRGACRLQWQGLTRDGKSTLADLGLRSQCTVSVMPWREHRRLAVGCNFLLALSRGGRVTCFSGDPDYEEEEPNEVPAHIGEAIEVAAGWEHSVALLVGGKVACWGNNEDGQCEVPEGLNAMQVAAFGKHTVCLDVHGKVFAWGNNEKGQCDPPEMGEAVMVDAGENHSMALLADGTVVCWGNNEDSQCNVPHLSHRVAQISAGYCHSIALLETGELVMWGAKHNLKYSDGMSLAFVRYYNERPHMYRGITRLPEPCPPATQVDAGGCASIALTADGEFFFWGLKYHMEYFGELDAPEGLRRSGAVQVAVNSSCVVLYDDDTIVSWGACNRTVTLTS
eukprot:Hpha_TRINITY_DN15189_c0_g1::TRINITY_DN15189_c0_g1_i2::g.127130::m.127130